MGIDIVHDLGDDQLQSHFNIIFPNGIPTGGNATNIVLRAKTHTVPDEELSVYDVAFHGQTFQMTGGPVESKTFDIVFRVDKNWETYKDLKRWKDYGADPENGSRRPDKDLRTTVIVQPVDIEEGGVEVPTRKPIIYKRVKLIKLAGIGFDHNTNEPVECTASFIYVKKSDKPYL